MGKSFGLSAFTSAKPVQRKLAQSVLPTNVERTFADHEIIVSKTDLKGHITYANDIFLRLADMSEFEALGAPHSVIRHPDMPRCIFKLLWGRLKERREIFAYVKNMSANGDHYWVLAHVTPSYTTGGEHVGYHSNRRKPSASIIQTVIDPLYKQLLAEEGRHGDRKSGLAASSAMLEKIIQSKGMSYDEFILSL